MWGSINGYVFEEHGAPIPAKVELTDSDFHFDHRDTDVSGFFSFDMLTPGEYTLKINSPGFAPITIKKTIAVENVEQYVLTPTITLIPKQSGQ